jgi:hypothetical protein
MLYVRLVLYLYRNPFVPASIVVVAIGVNALLRYARLWSAELSPVLCMLWVACPVLRDAGMALVLSCTVGG